jgi:hypothetical protein
VTAKESRACAGTQDAAGIDIARRDVGTHSSNAPTKLVPKKAVELAVELARRGWHVFPCSQRDKRPLTINGFKDASAYEPAVRKMFGKYPTAMIGVAGGEQSGVWCLDPDAPTEKNPIDGRENWKALQAEHGAVPPTHTHLTPGGGNHLIFKWRTDRAPITNSEGALKGKHINVRGEGGYFIAAGSVNSDGVEYRMAEPLDYFNFAPAPDWLHDLIDGKAEPLPFEPTISQRALDTMASRFINAASIAPSDNYAKAGLDKECAKLAATSADRNIALNNAAISLGRFVKSGELTEAEVVEALIEASITNGYDQEHGRKATLATIKSGMDAATARIKNETVSPNVETEKRTGKTAPISLEHYENFGTTIIKDWIIKNVIAAGETSSWIGPPGAGKSALVTDLAIHIASGKDWRGYRSKEQCGVVYFALERGELVKRRLIAHAGRTMGFPTKLPFSIARQVINLLKPTCVAEIVATIKSASEHHGRNIGVIIIDTYAKGIAAGGGDENSAKDQNMTLANLRRVQDETGVHVAIVGHTGKDETRGARGSNAFVGDVDMMVQFSGENNTRIAEIVINKDGADGVLTRYKLEVAVLGKDEDGDDITTAIVSTDKLDSDKDISRAELSKSQRKAMELLERAIIDEGRDAPVSSEYPRGIGKVVTLGTWKACCIKGGLSVGKKESADTAFRRAVRDLDAMHRIGMWDGNVWIAYE